MYAKIFHVSIKDLRICANNPALEDFVSKIIIRNFCACTRKSSTSLLRICVYAQIIQCWKTLLSKIIIRNFCACTQKSSTSLLRICVYAQIIQCWKTLLSKIIIRNFCACTQKSSTSLLRICVYAQKIQQMIIIKHAREPLYSKSAVIAWWSQSTSGTNAVFMCTLLLKKVIHFFIFYF